MLIYTVQDVIQASLLGLIVVFFGVAWAIDKFRK